MQRPRLNKVAKAHLVKIRAAGKTPTDEDIIYIHQLGETAINGEAADESRLLINWSVSVGRLKLYPFSIGAKLWQINRAEKWWTGDLMGGLSVLYASAHSLDITAFEFDSRAKAAAQVFGWATSKWVFSLTEREVSDGLKKIMSYDPQPLSDASKYESTEQLIELFKKAIDSRCDEVHVDTAARTIVAIAKDAPAGAERSELVSFLMHMYPGHTREYWMWDVTEDYCVQEYNNGIAIMHAKKGVEMKKPVSSPEIVAQKELNRITFEAIDGS